MNTYHMPIECTDLNSLEDNLWLIHKSLETNGFAWLKAWEGTEEVMGEICGYLGDVQFHIRSGSNGFVDVKPSTKTPNEIDASKYLGTGTVKFEAHTDGAYLHGLILENSNVVRIGPPQMIALQCIEPAEEGGTNFLIDAQSILRDLLVNEPLHARLLMQEGALSFCRDDQIAMDFPLFDQKKKGVYQVRFRSDEMTYAQHWALPSVLHVQNKYFNSPKYKLEVRMEKNHILIVDNTRMLHGRDHIPNTPQNLKRHLRRAWIADNSRSILMNISDSSLQHRAFESYGQYKKARSVRKSLKLKQLNLGIKLSPELQLEVAELLED